jgi:DNA processing protein
MAGLMTEQQLHLWVRLKSAHGIGPKTVSTLLERFGDVEEIFNAPFEEFAGIRGKDRAFASLHDAETQRLAEQRLELIRKLGITIIARGQPGYPRKLAQVPDPPTLIFAYGNLPGAEASVAIVGSRNPSPEGAEIAYDWAAAFARAGIPVASGLARGVDSAAHRGALSAKGQTIAVFGCGLDIVYPPEHKELAAEISRSGGALISEFWPGTPPDSGLFPVRNRTISGLADAVIVVEAAAQSGALITAAHARAQGRDVYAVPGPLSRQTSAGANKLLQQGAQIALCAEDIIKRLGQSPKDAAPRTVPVLPEDLASVYAALGKEGQHIDLIARQLGQTTPILLNRLLTLELRGMARQLPGKRFVRAGG